MKSVVLQSYIENSVNRWSLFLFLDIIHKDQMLEEDADISVCSWKLVLPGGGAVPRKGRSFLEMPFLFHLSFKLIKSQRCSFQALFTLEI